MNRVLSRRATGTATLADLLRMPEQDRFELVDGELVEKEGGSGRHGETQSNTCQSLASFNRRPGGGDHPGGWRFGTEILIEFSPRQVRLPDVAGWRRERLPEMPATPPVRVIPDWIAEIVSPSNASNDTVDKMRLYHAHHVPHYWLIDSRDETLTVYRWAEEGYLNVLAAHRSDRVRAEPFEAIELSVAALFGDDAE